MITQQVNQQRSQSNQQMSQPKQHICQPKQQNQSKQQSHTNLTFLEKISSTRGMRWVRTMGVGTVPRVAMPAWVVVPWVVGVVPSHDIDVRPSLSAEPRRPSMCAEPPFAFGHMNVCRQLMKSINQCRSMT